MKKQIIELAKKEKISEIGFCRAETYDKYAKDITVLPKLCKERKKSNEVLEGAKTIIVCAFNYFNGEKKGNISRYAQGIDYHIVAMQKMNSIAELIKENGYKAEAFSDNGYLNERLLAKLSGIAFIGKNKMAINRRLGSYFFIGYILTDYYIEESRIDNGACVGCDRCIKACPMGAIGEKFDDEKCLSYITQKKDELTEEEKNKILEANTIWGCDICQEVCPHNDGIEITDIDEFKENIITDLKLDSKISNRDFKKIYANRAFSWRGKGVLLRNLSILEKSQKKL